MSPRHRFLHLQMSTTPPTRGPGQTTRHRFIHLHKSTTPPTRARARLLPSATPPFPDYSPPPPPAVDSPHHHHNHMPHFPSGFAHHTHHSVDESANKPSVKMYCKAETNYSLSIRDGKVVLARSDPSDPFQHWIKDEKFSTRVKDEEGFPSFALINKATGQAMKHSIGATHPVSLISLSLNGSIPF
ncbi:UNVERIFIED_CONTAM: Ricin B-like lectin EULS3 [Sesamum latifolium]|uniref:Ricin B-like lectin EULS3 n=1 Tax=Sesamum latifolium TaxID=2727402 RepID=A0AAW2WBD7_9LAMI